VGDPPINLDDYVYGFAEAITGRPPRTAPYALLKVIAVAGDVSSRLGLRAPLTSSRLRSMTEDDPTPMQPTFDEFGLPTTSLEEGIAETMSWLKARGW
jgi:hypothetical protein